MPASKRVKAAASTRPAAQPSSETVRPCRRNCRTIWAPQRAERQPQAYFALPDTDHIAQRPVQADTRQRDRRQRKESQQDGAKPVLGEGVGDVIRERGEAIDRAAWLHLVNVAADGLGHGHGVAMRPRQEIRPGWMAAPHQ